MKDEIKEILEYIKDVDLYIEDNGYQYKRLSLREIKILLDYITNLQEENERLKAQNIRYEVKMNCLIQENDVLKENAEHNDKVVDKARWNEMIYKSRIDKAIEYIENENICREELPKYARIEINNFDKKYRNDLLNILQGSDEE